MGSSGPYSQMNVGTPAMSLDDLINKTGIGKQPPSCSVVRHVLRVGDPNQAKELAAEKQRIAAPKCNGPKP